jgi:hypothetical protein
LAFDSMTETFERSWAWTEHHFEDAETVVGRDARAAWRWTGSQLGKVGSGVAEGGVSVIGWVDSRTATYVPGHYYDTKIPLGAFPKLTPAALLDAIRHNPNSFPIPGDKNFELGTVVTLSFMGTRNPVIVKKIDTSDPNRASMLLQTQSGHFFKGTAEHIIVRQPNGQLIYEVIGHGPDRELWDRNRMNMWFGRSEWPRLVRDRVLPLAKKLGQ